MATPDILERQRDRIRELEGDRRCLTAGMLLTTILLLSAACVLYVWIRRIEAELSELM